MIVVIRLCNMYQINWGSGSVKRLDQNDCTRGLYGHFWEFVLLVIKNYTWLFGLP